jgi:hypothetical protein
LFAVENDFKLIPDADVKFFSHAKTNRPQQGHEALPSKISGTAIIG